MSLNLANTISPAQRARILCCVCLLFSNALSAETADDYQKRIKANAETIATLNTELNAAQRDRQKLLVQLQQTDSKMQGRKQRIDNLQRDIVGYEQQVNELEQSLKLADQRIREARKNVTKLMLSALRVRPNHGLKVALQHSDPVLASRLGIYHQYMIEAQADYLQSENTLLASAKAAHHEAVKSRNWLHYLKKKASGQHRTLAVQSKNSHREIEQLESSVREKTARVSDLKADQQRLGNLLEELKRNALGASGMFEAGKGRYPWPVGGERYAHFGEPKSIGNLTWRGMFIDSESGSQVRVIADGEVVYADQLQGFGMLVVVDHGDGYMTLYGGNRDLLVTQGDWVEFGSRIATVGRSGGQKRSGLYFEIRHNARPIDPELWVDAKNRFEPATQPADSDV